MEYRKGFYMKKQQQKSDSKHAIKWLLDVGWHYATMSEGRARQLAGVSKLTFNRYLSGETTPPAATLELLRMHAFGEPPGGFPETWRGFRFQGDKLITPDGRALAPADLMAVFFWKQTASLYINQQRRENPGSDPYKELRELYAA